MNEQTLTKIIAEALDTMDEAIESIVPVGNVILVYTENDKFLIEVKKG